MFNRKKGRINYSRIGDFIAPPKKKSYKGRIALAIGLIGTGVAFIASGAKKDGPK